MNIWIRRIILTTPGLAKPYYSARSAYNLFRTVRAARDCFRDLGQYRKALVEYRPGERTTIRTLDGLTFTIRLNRKDAIVVAEVFLDKSYHRHCRLSAEPVVVDIGAYIGDFALLAAKRLHARRVIAVEPSPSNFALLEKNVADNGFSDRIELVKAAVTDGRPAMLNIDAPEDAQFRVSAYYNASGLKEVRGISLEELLGGVETVDLLKIDCEGGEYLILQNTPDEVLGHVQNLVFEIHEIDGFASQLAAVKRRLANLGFALNTRGSLLSASRL